MLDEQGCWRGRGAGGTGVLEGQVIWDFLLYAVNMFCYHWLIKKLLWAYGRAD